jgi:uncharacterized protein YdhG (YjbR/CyaY superfamily)
VRSQSRSQTIDEYLAKLSDDKRRALEKLRKTIRAAAPKAEECISYGMPAFRLGRMLVAFGAAANHCSFFPMSSTILGQFETELKGYSASKGTIRFTPDKPLPATLVRRIVKARLEENESG